MKVFVVILSLLIVPLLMTGCAPKGEVIDPIEVRFDGNGCTVTGPTELPAGEHPFIFIDRSDYLGELWLVYLDDGNTTQDLLDGQSEPGDWYPKPIWAHYDSGESNKSEELEEGRVDTYTWKLDKVGEHTVICYVGYHKLLWIGAPLMIVEAPSE